MFMTNLSVCPQIARGLACSSAFVTLCAVALVSTPQFAPAQSIPGAPPGVVHRIQGPNERLEMTANSSRVITLDQKIPEVTVNNPDILKVTPISPNEIQLFAQKAGVTQVYLRTQDKQTFSIDVIVNGDSAELTMRLRTLFPKSSITVVPLANSVIISGFVEDPSHVDTIVRIAEDFYPNVINNVRVGGAQQVLLKVKVYEVSRTKLRNLGVDLSIIASGGQSAITNVSQLLAVTGANLQQAAASGNQTVTLGVVNAGSSTFAVVEALRQDQLAKVLAEPTLVTVSGRPAYFNAGGEFPILVPQSLGTVSIQYRPYGTQVDFVPIVLGSGRLRLEVRPRVSEIDAARSVTINGSTVPALTVREVDTGVEMLAGQTLAIGGLVQQRVEATRRGIPLLMDVPYLGVLFGRKHEQYNEIELLIMVTPEFAAAMDPTEVPQCLPGTFTTTPSDYQLYFKNHIEVPKVSPPGEYGAPAPGYDGSTYPGNMPGQMQPGMAPGQEPVPAPQPAPQADRRTTPPHQTASAAAPQTRSIPPTGTKSPATEPQPTQDDARGVVRAAKPPKLERIPAVDAPQALTPQPNPQNRVIPQTAQGKPITKAPGMIGPVGYDVVK